MQLDFHNRIKGFLRSQRRGRIEILLYHLVTDQDNDFIRNAHTLATRVFRDQLQFLAANFEIVPLRDIPSILTTEKSDQRSLAAVCFDDGYRNNILEAYPILAELGIPATVFVCSSVIDNQDLLWRDKVRLIVERGWEQAFINFLRRSPNAKRYGFRRLKKKTLQAWTKDPRSVSIGLIQNDIASFLRERGIDTARIAGDLDLFMHSEDIRAYPFLDFGNHTDSHPLLTRIDPAAQFREIECCHRFLARRKLDPVGLAVPFRPYNLHTLEICRTMGYQLVFTEAARSNPVPKSSHRGVYVLDRRMAPRTANILRQALAAG